MKVMKRECYIYVLFLVFNISALSAQTTQISGIVTDADDGQPLPGVSVVALGSAVGAITNVDGRYALENVPVDARLQFSFVGMTTQTVAVGGRQTIDIAMQAEAQAIDELVVTALGMTRMERTLGYSATTVKADDITAGKTPDAMSGLIGKAPGVSISSAGGSGTSLKVIVRGFSSLTGTNQPLYIVDGMPINNLIAGRQEMNNAVDFGNQANDINPENIESITILKGASATALYGSRAASGVVMITTKSGRQDEKVKVTYDFSAMGSNVLRVPQTQNSFGQGWYYGMYGDSGLDTDVEYISYWADYEQLSWGSRLDGRHQPWNLGPSLMYDPSDPRYREPRDSYFTHNKRGIRDFYETGFEMSNTITVSGGTNNSGFFASYSNFRSNGILPGNNDMYKRNNFSFRGNTKFFKDRADINYSITYSRKDKTDAMAGQGGNGATIYSNILMTPVNFDITDFRDYTDIYNNPDNFYTPYAMNPYWILAHNNANYQDDRIFGNIGLNFELVKGLTAMGRISGDFTASEQKFKNDKWMFSPGSWMDFLDGTRELGWYRHQMNRWNQIDAQGLLNAVYQFGDFSVDALAGVNVNQRTAHQLAGEFQELVEPGWFSFDNYAADAPSTAGFSQRRLIGALAQGEIGYRNFAFVTLSARNDWSSTLPKNNNSFFYWGTNASIIVTDMIPALKNNVMNFVKLRAAYGQTGNDAGVYLTESSYISSAMSNYFANISFPLSGISAYYLIPRIPAADLQPEITTEIEFGADFRLFSSRLTFDVSYYDRNTVNQIMDVTVAAETGFANRTANVGKIENKGVELIVGLVPVSTQDFRWNIGYTFSRNRSMVKELWDDVEQYTIASINQGVSYRARVGQPLGVFEFNDFLKVTEGEHEGKYIANNNTGMLQLDTAPDNWRVVGTSEGKFVMGLTNRFSYRNWSLGFTFDWRHGGMMFSNTKNQMYFAGTAPETAYNNREPFVIPNTVRNIGTTAAPVYVENNIPVNLISVNGMSDYWSYQTNRTRTVENTLLDRSYIKFRELNLTYSFPAEWFPDFISGLQISFVGRNLFLWTPKGQGFIDPDVTNYGNDLVSQFGEYFAAPSTRVLGGSVRVVF